MNLLTRVLLLISLPPAPGAAWRDERGDVPGWVLITVMTAGLVAVLWAIAGDALSTMLRDALSSVSSG